MGYQHHVVLVLLLDQHQKLFSPWLVSTIATLALLDTHVLLVISSKLPSMLLKLPTDFLTQHFGTKPNLVFHHTKNTLISFLVTIPLKKPKTNVHVIRYLFVIQK